MKKTVILLICALLAGGSAVQAQRGRIIKKGVQTLFGHGVEVPHTGPRPTPRPFIYPLPYPTPLPTPTPIGGGIITPTPIVPIIEPDVFSLPKPQQGNPLLDELNILDRMTQRQRAIQSGITNPKPNTEVIWNTINNQATKSTFSYLGFICVYHNEAPYYCHLAGQRLMDLYWQEALKQNKSYWAWSAYLKENLRGELRDKAKEAIAHLEEPALMCAQTSDNYSDCADFCLMYPTSYRYREIIGRFKELLKHDREADTLNLIAGRCSHRDSAIVVLNNATKGKTAVRLSILDKTSGECITTTELTPGCDAVQLALHTGDYAIAMEYTKRGFLWRKQVVTDTFDLDAKQYVYHLKVVIGEEDSVLMRSADALVNAICTQENSLITNDYNAIRNRRAQERHAVEARIDSIMLKSYTLNLSTISCGSVDMTGANIGTTLIIQNLLLSYVPHDLLKKDDRFVVYTIHANDDSTHAPIIVAAPCYPKTPIEVEQREQALRTLDFFLAADTMANPKQHGTIHFVFYKMDEYLYQIGDLFKGKTDSPRVALAFDEWVIDTINVESPDSQGNVTFTPPVQNIKLDYSNTTLPHALYHLSPAMAGVLPESIYSVLR